MRVSLVRIRSFRIILDYCFATGLILFRNYVKAFTQCIRKRRHNFTYACIIKKLIASIKALPTLQTENR